MDEEPDGYILMHSRATDTLYFGPFMNLDEVREFLVANPTVREVLIPVYKTVNWNRKG